MTRTKAIEMLKRMQDPEPYEPKITEEAKNALDIAIKALEQVQKLQNRCYAVSRGTLCVFCKMECEARKK
jgi:hypothetical protein